MISISGIKYQKELEALPYFNKQTATILIGKKSKNLDKKIEQLLKKKYLLSLKKGLYVSSSFVEKADRGRYEEYIANILRFPSYLSLEYALSQYGLIPEGVRAITSLTLKSGRTYQNFLGTFIYRNIKEELFFGFSRKDFQDKKIKIATPAKALFDFLYLKKIKNTKKEISEDLRVNWDNFSKSDLEELRNYVKKADSPKMKRILRAIEKEV